MVQTQELLPIKEIEIMPTVENGIHESIYQSHAILQHVKIMIMRKDSKSTILGFINHFEPDPIIISTST